MIQISEGQEWILDMVNNILIEVLGSIAEQERLATRKRQREGIDAARKKGKHLGRPKIQMPDNFGEIYTLWNNGDITAKEAMKILNLRSSSFYRMVQSYELIIFSKSR